MSLLPLRQEDQINVDFICPYTQERGGILTLASASGMTFVQYAHNGSGTKPIGIQLNDVEWINMTRAPFQQYIRNIDVPCSIVGAGVDGMFITDWIYLIGAISSGDPAYVGPSGTFTNDQSLGGTRVGYFLGALENKPHLLTMRGLGFTYQYIDPYTKTLVIENDPNNRVLVNSPGYAKIRVNVTP